MMAGNKRAVVLVLVVLQVLVSKSQVVSATPTWARWLWNHVTGLAQDDQAASLFESPPDGSSSYLALLWGVPDTVAWVGQLFEYHIPHNAFSGHVSLYTVKEAGSDDLPPWLYFNTTSNTFLGVPSPLDQGAVAIHVTALNHGTSGSKHKVSVSTHFILSVQPVSDQSGNYLSDMHKQVDIRHGREDPTGKSSLVSGACQLDQNIYRATLVLDTNMQKLAARERVEMLYKAASFLSQNPFHVSLGPRRSDSVARLLDTKTVRAGPGDLKGPSDNTGVELSWLVGCGEFINTGDLARVLAHNIQVGRLQEELGMGIIGWILTETLPPEPLRRLSRQRRQVRAFNTPMPTPTLSATLPTKFTGESTLSAEETTSYSGSLYVRSNIPISSKETVTELLSVTTSSVQETLASDISLSPSVSFMSATESQTSFVYASSTVTPALTLAASSPAMKPLPSQTDELTSDNGSLMTVEPETSLTISTQSGQVDIHPTSATAVMMSTSPVLPSRSVPVLPSGGIPLEPSPTVSDSESTSTVQLSVTEVSSELTDDSQYVSSSIAAGQISPQLSPIPSSSAEFGMTQVVSVTPSTLETLTAEFVPASRFLLPSEANVSVVAMTPSPSRLHVEPVSRLEPSVTVSSLLIVSTDLMSSSSVFSLSGYLTTPEMSQDSGHLGSTSVVATTGQEVTPSVAFHLPSLSASFLGGGTPPYSSYSTSQSTDRMLSTSSLLTTSILAPSLSSVVSVISAVSDAVTITPVTLVDLTPSLPYSGSLQSSLAGSINVDNTVSKSDLSLSIPHSVAHTVSKSAISDLSLSSPDSVAHTVSKSAISDLSLSSPDSVTHTVSKSAISDLSLSSPDSVTHTVSKSAISDLSLSSPDSVTHTVSKSAISDLSLSSPDSVAHTVSGSVSIAPTVSQAPGNGLISTSISASPTVSSSLNTYLPGQSRSVPSSATSSVLVISVVSTVSTDLISALPESTPNPSLQDVDPTSLISSSFGVTMLGSTSSQHQLVSTISVSQTIELPLTAGPIASKSVDITPTVSVDFSIAPTPSSDFSIAPTLSSDFIAPTLSSDFSIAPTLSSDFSIAPTLSSDFSIAPTRSAAFSIAPTLSSDFIAPTLSSDFSIAPTLSSDFSIAPTLSSDFIAPTLSSDFSIAPTLSSDFSIAPTLSSDFSVVRTMSTKSPDFDIALTEKADISMTPSTSMPFSVSSTMMTPFSVAPSVSTFFSITSTVSKPFSPPPTVSLPLDSASAVLTHESTTQPFWSSVSSSSDWAMVSTPAPTGPVFRAPVVPDQAVSSVSSSVTSTSVTSVINLVTHPPTSGQTLNVVHITASDVTSPMVTATSWLEGPVQSAESTMNLDTLGSSSLSATSAISMSLSPSSVPRQVVTMPFMMATFSNIPAAGVSTTDMFPMASSSQGSGFMESTKSAQPTEVLSTLPDNIVVTTATELASSSVTMKITPSDERVTTSQSILMTTSPVNTAPVLVRSIHHIDTQLGVYFEYRVPRDTFYDHDDGYTRMLRLRLLTLTMNTLPPDSWVQFDTQSQTIFGLPLIKDIPRSDSDLEFVLVATDSGGLEAHDAIKIHINRTSIVVLSHQFTITFNIDFVSLTESTRNVVNLLQAVSKYFGDSSPNNMTVTGLRSGSVLLSWSNNTVSRTMCDNETMEGIYAKLGDGGQVNPDFQRALYPTYPVLRVGVTFSGACIVKVASEPPEPVVPPVAPSSDSAVYYYTVLPAVILAVLIFIIAVILLCLHRRRRSAGRLLMDDEKPIFAKNRHPVLLENELELRELAARPKRPCVMMNVDGSYCNPAFQMPVRHPAQPPPYHMKPSGAFGPVFDGIDDVDISPPPEYSTRGLESGGITRPPPMYRLPPPYTAIQSSSDT